MSSSIIIEKLIAELQQIIKRNTVFHPDLALLQMKAFDSSIINHYKLKDGADLDFTLIWPRILIFSYEDFSQSYYSRLPISLDYPDLIMENMFIHQRLNEMIKVKEMYNYGLVKIEDFVDNSITITLNDNMNVAYEYLEKSDYELSKDDMSIKRNNKRELSISRIMNKKVSVFKSKYIKYTTNKKIDDYYRHLASKFTKEFYGKNTFNSEASFNGISFRTYVDAIELFISIALKHFDYCALLVKKEPQIKWFDILTVNKSINEEIETLIIGLDITYCDAEKIIDLLTFTKSDLVNCINKKGVYPIFIRLSREMLARSTLSLISGSPYMYLLSQLQFRFPKDWSREHPNLEVIFRNDIYDIFKLRKKCICLNSNINLNINKRRVTDVDAVIIDYISNTILLFQLKWQEPFGESIIERESKKKNFIKTSEKWIIEVQNWLLKSTSKEKADAFKSSQSIMKQTWDFKFFIVGRYFSRFSYKTYNDKNITWCNWYRFKTIAEKIDVNTPNYFFELSEKIELSYKLQQKSLNIENKIKYEYPYNGF